MQFNPKIGFVLGILVTIETAISGGLLNLTNAIPDAYIPTVHAWAAILAFAGSAILTGLHAYSSGEQGPLVGASVPVPKTALILAIALSALALAWAGPAGAQGVPRLTGNPAKDFAPKPSASVTTPSGALNYDSLGQQFQALVKDVIDKAILDLTAASKDAGGQAPPDLISQPCWDAQVAFLRLLPAEWAEPPKDVGPALAIQIGRDLRRALTGDQKGTIKVDCAALFGDELAQVGKLGSLVGLKLLTGGLAP